MAATDKEGEEVERAVRAQQQNLAATHIKWAAAASFAIVATLGPKGRKFQNAAGAKLHPFREEGNKTLKEKQ